MLRIGGDLAQIPQEGIGEVAPVFGGTVEHVLKHAESRVLIVAAPDAAAAVARDRFAA